MKELAVPGPRWVGVRDLEAERTVVRAKDGGRCVEADY